MSAYEHPAKPGGVAVGFLRRYDDHVRLREATEQETIASIRAALHDGGAGAIVVDFVKCYVDGGTYVCSCCNLPHT